MNQVLAALLKCRYAGRYDNLGSPNRIRATETEAKEEQKAASIRINKETWILLGARGLIVRTGGQVRLTKEGFETLAKLLAERTPK